MVWIVEKALLGLPGQNFWWVAPGYNQSEIAFRRIKQGLTRGAFTATESPNPKITLINGAVIWFKSGDNADNLYGEDVFGAVIDEASRVKEDCWFAIRSTLTATNGPVRIIGNVKGRKNWFYNLARKAEAGSPYMHYAKITAMDAVSAGVTKAEEVEEARDVLPDNIFKELYYAEPGDDSGNPFGIKYIQSCLNEDGLGQGPVKSWGIDLAKSTDWFVCIGLNELGEVCKFERWQGVPWRVSIQKAWALVGEDTSALVDSTGLGDPVLEELQVEHGNFQGFNFSSSSKQKLMEGLAVAIQKNEISFPKGIISAELESFEYEYTRTGVRYSAPEGCHDDCVCALALARQCWVERGPGENLIKFYALASAKQKEAQSTQPAEVDNPRPWRNYPESEDILENELTELYNATAQKAFDAAYGPKLCYHCGKPVLGGSRASDGEFVWHPECTGLSQTLNLRGIPNENAVG